MTKSILYRTWILYLKALRTWGWILVLVVLITALVGIYQLNSRIDKAEATPPYVVVNVTYRFDQTIGSGWGFLAGWVKETVDSLNLTPSVRVSYKDFDHNRDNSIDMGVLQFQSRDEVALKHVQAQMLPVIDHEIRIILKRRMKVVEKALIIMERRLGNLDSPTWNEEGVIKLRDVKSVIIDYESIRQEYKHLKRAIENLEAIRQIERVEKKSDFIAGKSIYSAVPRFLLFSFVAGLLIVFIVEIGLLRSAEIVSDEQ